MGSIGIGNWNKFAQGVGSDLAARAGGQHSLDSQAKATKAYVPTTGVSRVLWCIFTLGINEAVRSSKIRAQENAMRDMSAGIGRLHHALSFLTKLEMESAYHRRAVEVGNEEEGFEKHTMACAADKVEHEHYHNLRIRQDLLRDEDADDLPVDSGCRLIPAENVEHRGYMNGWGRHPCLELAMGSGENACTVRLHVDDEGKVHMVVPRGTEDERGNPADYVQELGRPSNALRKLEMTTAANSEVFSPDMFKRMLNNYDDSLKEFRPTNHRTLNQGDFRNQFRQQQLDICRKILESRCNMPKEKLEYLDRGMAKDLALAAARGDLDKPGACEAFYDKITSVRHLNSQDSMKLYDQLDKEAAGNLPVSYREAEQGLHAVKTDENRASLPTEEQQGVHDFAADLVYDGDAGAYDRDIDTNGRLNGQRLCTVFSDPKHRATISRLVEERLAAPGETPQSLGSLDEGMRTVITKLVDQLISETKKQKGPVTKEDVVAQLDEHIGAYKKSLKDAKGKHLENPRQLGDLSQEALYLGAGIGIAASQDDELGDDASYGVADLKMKQMKRREHVQEGSDGDPEELWHVDLDQKIAEAQEEDDKNRIRLESAGNFFAQVEAELDQGLGASMDELQGKISRMVDEVFPAPAEGQDVFAGKTNDEIIADVKNDPETQLLRKVLHDYFKSMPKVDQRSMLASMTRNSVAGASDQFKFGQILKGAGPILQKMLQGLDPDAFKDKPDFAAAIQDMRNNLAPLPRRVVNAHLLDIVKTYNADPAHGQNKIGNIEVKHSCGAASVAQTLLCKISFENGTSQDCVIKVLRPEAKLRAMREAELFTRHAGTIRGMKETFESRLSGIMEEFDFRIEAANVGKGKSVYEGYGQIYDHVHSMHLFPGIAPTPGAMVLEMAPGTTLSNYTKKVDEDAKDVAGVAVNDIRMRNVANVDGVLLNSCDDLTKLYDDTLTKHDSLYGLTFTWIKEGLFASKKGFYHGDLHAGNIMVPEFNLQPKPGVQPVDPKLITMIDFGNARELMTDEQAYVIRVVAGAASGEEGVDLFADGFTKLLSAASLEKFVYQDGPDKGKVRREIKDDLAAVFRQGNCNDAAKRMKAALRILQGRYDIAIPGPINDFLMSQDRLAVAMESTLRSMTQIEMRRLAVIVEAARTAGFAQQDLTEALRRCEEAFEASPTEGNARNLFQARLALANAFVDSRIANENLGEDDKVRYRKLKESLEKSANDRPVSMMQCMVNVIKQNILTALKRVGSLSESRRLEQKFREEGLIGGDDQNQQAAKEYRFVKIEA